MTLQRKCFKEKLKKTIILLTFLHISYSAYSFELSITDKNVGIEFHPEYNHSFYYSYDIYIFGLIEFNKSLILSSGIAMGQTWDTFDISAYTSVEYAFPFFRKFVPMNFKFAYMYNGLPDFEVHTHTILPLFSLKWKYGGGSIGYIGRFTYFDKESPALYEPVLAYSVFANFYNTEKATVGVRLSNFDDFSARNLGAYSFYFDNKFNLNEHFSIISNIEIAMSGNVAQITSVYGISFIEGVVFKW
jgi:hypothetical protein